MTADEIRAAFREQHRVIYKGIRYSVSAMIARFVPGKGLVQQVELLDGNRHSVVIASPAEVEPDPNDPTRR